MSNKTPQLPNEQSMRVCPRPVMLYVITSIVSGVMQILVTPPHAAYCSKEDR